MNETIKLINEMRSIREFSSREISEKDLESILLASTKASCASARQNYSIIVVREKELLEKLFYNANIGLIFCVDFNRIIDTARHLKYKKYNPNNIFEFITGSTDTILAAQNAAITAKSLGISSLFTNSIHRVDLSKLYDIFKFPKEYIFPLIALCLGYAEKIPERKRGRYFGPGLIHYDTYKKMTHKEIKNQIYAYDNPENSLGLLTKEQFNQQGFEHYFDWFFTKWARARSPELLRSVNDTLRKSNFLE